MQHDSGMKPPKRLFYEIRKFRHFHCYCQTHHDCLCQCRCQQTYACLSAPKLSVIVIVRVSVTMLVTVDVTSFFIINQTTCLSSNFQAVQHCHCQCFSCFSLSFSLSRKRTCLPSNFQTVLLLPSATSTNCTSKAPVRLPDLVLIKCSYNVLYVRKKIDGASTNF